MLADKERFSKILLDEKNEIEELKKFIKGKGSLYPRIKKIRDDLGLIEMALKSMEKEFNDRIKHIEEIDNKIKLLNFEVQSRDIDTMANIISNNLPDGFDGFDGSGGIENSEEYDENNLKSIQLRYKSTNKINFRKSEEIPNVGKINILGTEDKQFKVIVTLGDKMNANFKEAEFNIPNLYRIYKIIAWINTNLHYNE
jgi:hypothetical protein